MAGWRQLSGLQRSTNPVAAADPRAPMTAMAAGSATVSAVPAVACGLLAGSPTSGLSSITKAALRTLHADQEPRIRVRSLGQYKEEAGNGSLAANY